MRLKSKIKILESCTIPILYYGCQTWSLTKNQMNRIKSTQKAMERSVLGLKGIDKIRNKNIRGITKIKDIGYTTKKAKFKYVGHIARLDNVRWVKKVTDWTPYGKIRRKGRPQTRWGDEIRNRVGLTWGRAALNRKMWRNIGEAYAREWAIC